MNENLPIHVQEMQSDGVITYASDVIAIIAGMAVNEVDGVASMINTNAIADLFNRAKPITRGVKVEVGIEEASVDVVLTVEYGKPIQKVCTDVQESVRKAIETMTGLHCLKVDVHVMGVSFERETKEMAQGYVKATAEQKILDEANPHQPATETAKVSEDESKAVADEVFDDFDDYDNQDDAEEALHAEDYMDEEFPSSEVDETSEE